MKKGDWYKHLFGRIDHAIQDNYFFEATFIEYGIIEDRLSSVLRQLGLNQVQGVAKKINAIARVRDVRLERAFGFSNWDGGKYKKLGLLQEIKDWGELYRNPMQHLLGDPQHYQAEHGGFHTDNTRDLAVEGRRVSRGLSSAVMRFKK